LVFAINFVTSLPSSHDDGIVQKRNIIEKCFFFAMNRVPGLKGIASGWETGKEELQQRSTGDMVFG